MKTVGNYNKLNNVVRGLKTIELYSDIHKIFMSYQFPKSEYKMKVELLTEQFKIRQYEMDRNKYQ
jgi:hypothetical protein